MNLMNHFHDNISNLYMSYNLASPLIKIIVRNVTPQIRGMTDQRHTYTYASEALSS